MSTDKPLFPETIDLEAFISQEAHDLKSPFNRILGFTRMVLKGMDGPLTDLQREDLTTVYENSRQAMDFLSNLIDMARLNRGEKKPDWDACVLEDILSAAVKTWRTTFAEEHAALQMNLPPEGCLLQGDAILLRQALRNLLLYATRWVQPPSEVVVSVEHRPDGCLLLVQSRGEMDIAAPEMELTMWGFVAGRIIALHRGEVRTARRGEKGVEFEILLPRNAA